jgi:transcriptional regulator with XRE-family HTH domain
VQSFGPLLVRTLKRQRISQNELARRLRMHPSMISKVIRGTRAPNWKHGDAWVSALGLSGPEAYRFLDELHLAAASPRIRLMVRRLQFQARSTRTSTR